MPGVEGKALSSPIDQALCSITFMQGEVKDHTHGKCVACRGKKTPVLAQ